MEAISEEPREARQPGITIPEIKVSKWKHNNPLSPPIRTLRPVCENKGTPHILLTLSHRCWQGTTFENSLQSRLLTSVYHVDGDSPSKIIFIDHLCPKDYMMSLH